MLPVHVALHLLDLSTEVLNLPILLLQGEMGILLLRSQLRLQILEFSRLLAPLVVQLGAVVSVERVKPLPVVSLQAFGFGLKLLAQVFHFSLMLTGLVFYRILMPSLLGLQVEG